jgi:hypothetical protein
MTTANTLISRALRLCSSYSPGQGIDGAELTDNLQNLNDMIGSWSADNFIPPYRTIEGFVLTSGTTSYSIGSGATFSTARPDIIKTIFIRDQNGNDTPTTELTREQYDNIALKTAQGRPQWWMYDTQYPNGVIYFYTTPDMTYTAYIDSLKPLTQFTSSTDTVNLPGEYNDLIVYNLAPRLAMEYGFPVSQEMLMFAETAIKKVKRKNAQLPVSNFDAATLSRHTLPLGWNIYNI